MHFIKLMLLIQLRKNERNSYISAVCHFAYVSVSISFNCLVQYRSVRW